MLLKNGEREARDLKKKYKDLFSLIGKNKTQVTFKLSPSIYDGKKKKPRSYRLPSGYVSVGENGNTDEYIYYESSTNRNIGGVVQPTYAPNFMAPIEQRGEVTINLGPNIEDNLDKFVWWMNHPRRSKGDNADETKNPLFYLEDKAAEAASKVKMKQANAAMQKYLYDEDSRMSEDDLRTIAKALRVDKVDDLTFPEVVTSIEFKCSRNPQLFLSFKGVGKEVQMRSNLQVASERGIITYDSQKQKWFLNDKDSGAVAPLAPVRQTENEMNALIYWIKNKDVADSYGKIMELITGISSQPKKSQISEDAGLEIKLKLAEAENKKLELEAKKAEAEAKKAEAELALAGDNSSLKKGSGNKA